MAPDKVLVALDDTRPAFRALQWALRRAARMKDDLWALAVLDTRKVIVTARVGTTHAAPVESYAERLTQVLEQARALAATQGVRLQTEIEASGNPAEAIVAFARDHQFDLLVLGHREKRGIEKVVLGSTALRVLELTDIPVTIVR